MRASATPRAILVWRESLLQQFSELYGTKEQARFQARSRHQDLAGLERADAMLHDGIRVVDSLLPPDWRRTRVSRDLLDRFLFAPGDVVLAVGQDGLVANVAKYLTGQLVIGVNPDPSLYDGVLCRFAPLAVAPLIESLSRDPVGSGLAVEERTMVRARRSDGQQLLGVNEIFVGHQSHQSARYLLSVGGRDERHSSSGLICTTGTGATGWARSIATQRAKPPALPQPEDGWLTWFVREPFPSVATQVDLDGGILKPGESLRVVSELGQGGVAFADGIESDRLDFVGGQLLEISAAREKLRLVVGAGAAR